MNVFKKLKGKYKNILHINKLLKTFVFWWFMLRKVHVVSLKNFKPLSGIVSEICVPKMYEINISCIGTS